MAFFKLDICLNQDSEVSEQGLYISYHFPLICNTYYDMQNNIQQKILKCISLLPIGSTLPLAVSSQF